MVLAKQKYLNGSPWQNRFIESFYARVVIEDWRNKDNPILLAAPSAASLPSSSRTLLWKLARLLGQLFPSAGALPFSTISKRH